jgi:hypothetical protein
VDHNVIWATTTTRA